MIRSPGVFTKTLIVALMLLSSDVSTAQTSVLWVADSADYNDEDSWDEGIIPAGSLDEIAEINNGGTAILDEEVVDEPGGIILGRLNVDVGNMEIRSGGSMTTLESEFSITNGSVVVGQTGEGHLTVHRGGELTAESLTSGGSVFSSITLGEIGGSGTAAVTVNRTANLQRNTTIVGPNVDFDVTSLLLGGGQTLTEVITGATHSTINVAANATLGGALEIEFDDYQPAIGDSWNLVDAAGISGNFNRVTADLSKIPSGTGLFTSQSAGGENGNVFQVSIDTQLVLSIDRRSGLAAIENRTATESVDIDGYLVTSPTESLVPSEWNSLEDQGQANWVESNPSSAHIGELNLQGSLAVGSDSSLGLGELYSFTPSAIGEAFPEVSFEYHLADGETIPGQVDFTGLHNNVVLMIDPETGNASLQNQSLFDVEIDGYLITSSEGILDVDGWNSLQDNGQAGWTESNPSENHLGELNLGESLALGSVNAPISIGTPFSNLDDLGELTFEFHIAGGATLEGTVEFGGLTDSDPLDCSGDGMVGSADLECILRSGGPTALAALLDATGFVSGDLNGDGEVGFGDFLQLSVSFGQEVDSYTQGDINGDGEVAFGDFLELSVNFGRTGGAVAAVPEPFSGLIAVCGILVLLTTSRQSRRGLESIVK